MSAIARVSLTILATVEVLAVVGVLAVATLPTINEPRHAQVETAPRTTFIDGIQKCVLAIAFVLLGHLGLCATAIRVTDVCSKQHVVFPVIEYLALSGFTLMYFRSSSNERSYLGNVVSRRCISHLSRSGRAFMHSIPVRQSEQCGGTHLRVLSRLRHVGPGPANWAGGPAAHPQCRITFSDLSSNRAGY